MNATTCPRAPQRAERARRPRRQGFHDRLAVSPATRGRDAACTRQRRTGGRRRRWLGQAPALVGPWWLAIATACALSAPRAAFAQTVRPEIVAAFPHDVEAYTQGLLLRDGRFYESTGLEGRSSLRRVVPETGQVERRIELAADLFGEGLALVEQRFIQLTWKNEIALVYDLEFERVGTFRYQGEGWGLCNDGSRLVMSDGSSRLYFRDLETFAALGEIEVVRAGMPVARLNELECVGQLVYANVYQTDTIVRIDPASGEVLTTIDASGLLSAAEAADADVLNGIAFDDSSGHFFLTGKLWPKLFEVRFDFDPFAEAPSTEIDGGRQPDGGPGEEEDSGSTDGSMSVSGSTRRDGGVKDGGADATQRADATSGRRTDAGRAALDAGAKPQDPPEDSDTEAPPDDPSSAHESGAGGGCSLGAPGDRGAPGLWWLTLLFALRSRLRRGNVLHRPDHPDRDRTDFRETNARRARACAGRTSL